MNEKRATVYEPPVLVELGGFTHVTMGNGGGGFDTCGECWFWCDR
ncbi:lasso RiPP family leader peptide-containing protein [Streptomyces sp. TRM70308]